ncbi:MAG: hypothetical protein JWR32_885 [Mycobacterium sp.]|jgi:hypothetical protein|nr:hypothetical protein [Mycobacterium sp.]
MNIIGGAVRVFTQTTNAATAAVGALGGAAVNGVIGGVQGTAAGIRNGADRGSHSTPAAALTLAAVGAAGLVEWPVLLAVGGTALVVRQLSQRSSAKTDVGSAPQPQASTSTVGKRTPSSRRRSTATKPSKTAARTSPRRPRTTAKH